MLSCRDNGFVLSRHWSPRNWGRTTVSASSTSALVRHWSPRNWGRTTGFRGGGPSRDWHWSPRNWGRTTGEDARISKGAEALVASELGADDRFMLYRGARHPGIGRLGIGGGRQARGLGRDRRAGHWSPRNWGRTTGPRDPPRAGGRALVASELGADDRVSDTLMSLSPGIGRLGIGGGRQDQPLGMRPQEGIGRLGIGGGRQGNPSWPMAGASIGRLGIGGGRQEHRPEGAQPRRHWSPRNWGRTTGDAPRVALRDRHWSPRNWGRTTGI